MIRLDLHLSVQDDDVRVSAYGTLVFAQSPWPRLPVVVELYDIGNGYARVDETYFKSDGSVEIRLECSQPGDRSLLDQLVEDARQEGFVFFGSAV
jgi:hypothetical protein